MSTLMMYVVPLYARNGYNYIHFTVEPLPDRRGRNILTIATLTHVYGFTGLAAGAHAFVAGYVKRSGKPVDLSGTKPNVVVINDVNDVTYGLNAVRAEGQALFSIYYYL